MSLKSLWALHCSISPNNSHLYAVTFKSPNPWSRTLGNYELHLLFSLRPPPANWTMKTELTPALHLWPGSTIYRARGWGFLAGLPWWMQNFCSCTRLNIQTVNWSSFYKAKKKKSFSTEKDWDVFPIQKSCLDLCRQISAGSLSSWALHNGGCCMSINLLSASLGMELDLLQ